MRRALAGGLAAALAVLAASFTTPPPAQASLSPTAGSGASVQASSATSTGFDPAAFVNPPADSQPPMYWYWNGTITADLADEQMAQMRAKGIHAAILFPFGGDLMKPAFFSEDWFTLVDHVLREAQRTGMKMWLFNDNNFPSGRGAGLVVNGGSIGGRTLPAHPELRLKGLVRSTRVVQGPATVDLTATTGLSVDAGRLVVDPAVSPGAAAVTSGIGWSDYTATGKVTLTKPGTQLMVRSSADGKRGYLVDVDPKGVASVWRVDGSGRTRLSTGVPTPGFSASRAQTVTVKVSGSQITPTINNTVQPTATDTTYGTGTVAVTAEGAQRSLWDTLSVTSGSGSSLWAQTFDDSTVLAEFSGDRTSFAGASAVSARPAGSTDGNLAVELTGRLTDGTWQVPPGRWQIDLFGSAPLIDDSNGYSRDYLDLMDPQAVDLFLDAVAGEYVRRFPWAMGTVVPGFWDDESFISSADAHFKRLPWSPGLAAGITKAGGTPGVAYTAAFDKLGRSGELAGGSYWRAVNDAFSSQYYGRQAQWMQEHGLKLISNPLWDEAGPQRRMPSTGDLAKDNQWAQVPGTDVITSDYVAGQQTTLGRNAASAAHQSGADRVVLESFGNMGWQIAPEFMHAMLGALATRGANMPVLHAMWTDETTVYFPPPFGPRSTFWHSMDTVDTWISRLTELGRGTSLAQTALIQPQRAAEQAMSGDGSSSVDSDLTATSFALERSQVDFDLLSDGSLSGDPGTRYQGVAQAGSLQVGQARYRMLVLPPTPVLDLETVRSLARFVQVGGHLLTVGALPTREARGRDAQLQTALAALVGDAGPSWTRRGTGAVASVATAAAVGQVAASGGFAAATLSPVAESVRVLRVGRGSETAFTVNNESAAAVTTTLTLPVGGVPEIWDPQTGRTAPAGSYTPRGSATEIPLTLRPYETLGIVFRAGTKAGPHLTGEAPESLGVAAEGTTLTAAVLVDRSGAVSMTGADGPTAYQGSTTVTDPLDPVALAGPWTLRLERDGAPTFTRPLGSWTDLDPKFSGTGIYTTTTSLTAQQLAGRRMVLDLGEVHDVARITVNGQVVDPALWTPYAVDVTSALRSGDNSIEVQVSNTLANERNKILPSGLFGPVTLRPRAVVDVTLTRTAEGDQ